jgi:hypothetical protein
MSRQQGSINHAIVAACVVASSMMVLTTACGDDERGGTGVYPVGSGPTGSGGGGEGGAAAACEDGVVEECKVQIDANNCFVGEHQCQDGMWGDCVDKGTFGETSFHTNALTAPGGCPTNDCNPYCQQFDEDPAPDVTNTGSAPPLGGTVNGLPSAFQNAGLNDLAHTGVACDEVSDCQYDHYCDTGTGNCAPWPGTGSDPAAGGPDLTVPVICDPSSILVCNRGSAPAVAPIEVVVVANGATGDFGACNPLASGSVHDVCSYTGPDIAAGDCVAVTGCDLSGTKSVYVNPPEPPGVDGTMPIAESSSLAGSACGNNWSLSHNSATCNCSATSVAQALQPVTMFMVLDNSVSMGPGYNDLWDPATSAVKTFVQDPSADPINFAIRLYNNPGGGCGGVHSTAAVGPDNLSNAAHQAALVTFIDGQSPNANTPHRDSIHGAMDWATAYKLANPTEKVVVVYISDGSTGGTCSGTDGNGVGDFSAPASVAKADGIANAYIAPAHTAGVDTYTVALPAASTLLLGVFATAGGTTMIDLTGSVDVDTDLTAALTDILDNLLTCDINIPNAGQVDPAEIAAEYLPNGMTPATALTKVANAAACTAGNEYYLDDPVNPTMITLCPSICTTVQGDSNAVVNVVGGCMGGYSSETFVYDYFGDCSGFSTAGAQWDFLSYDTTTPGSATVQFEIGTGNSAAEAAADPGTLVSTATSVAPDIAAGSPLDLATALGAVSTNHSYIELRVTLNPTIDGSAAPTLHDWRLSYSCLDNE